MINNKFLFCFVVIFLFFVVCVSSESSMNFLSKGFADTLYCWNDGTNCAINYTGNITQGWWNVTGSVYLFNDSGILDVNETALNVFLVGTFTHLTNFSDDLGNRGFDSLSNFSNDLGFAGNCSVAGSCGLVLYSDFDNSGLYWNSTSNKLGIGSIPVYALDVSGQVRFNASGTKPILMMSADNVQNGATISFMNLPTATNRLIDIYRTDSSTRSWSLAASGGGLSEFDILNSSSSKMFIFDISTGKETLTGLIGSTRGGEVIVDSQGYQNIFLGYQSSGTGLTGTGVDSPYGGNTCIGDASCAYLTTGFWNSCLGANSCTFLTTGRENLAFGQGALYGATYPNTANYNAAIGRNSMGKITSGQQNVGNGYYSLYLVGAGSYNTGLGHSALYNNSGNFNTGIGYKAGYGNNGSSNIFIGSYAGYSETGSNTLYIHNNKTTEPLIYGEFDSRNLKINGNLNVTQKTFITDLNFNSSFTIHRTIISANYTTVSTDYLIAVTDTTGGRSIVLSSADCINGRTIIIKDEGGTAGGIGTSITISTEGAELIDGENTFFITANYDSTKIYSNGVDWFTI